VDREGISIKGGWGRSGREIRKDALKRAVYEALNWGQARENKVFLL
jgi:hypothetical protein